MSDTTEQFDDHFNVHFWFYFGRRIWKVSAWVTKRNIDFRLELPGRERSGAQTEYFSYQCVFFQCIGNQLKTASCSSSLKWSRQWKKKNHCLAAAFQSMNDRPVLFFKIVIHPSAEAKPVTIYKKHSIQHTNA